MTAVPDMVANPPHYTSHPSGVECIQITEHMNFCIGNAIKYLFRADEKGDPIENLRKAAWYVDREIKRRQADDPTEAQETPAPITVNVNLDGKPFKQMIAASNAAMLDSFSQQHGQR